MRKLVPYHCIQALRRWKLLCHFSIDLDAFLPGNFWGQNHRFGPDEWWLGWGHNVLLLVQSTIFLNYLGHLCTHMRLCENLRVQ